MQNSLLCVAVGLILTFSFYSCQSKQKPKALALKEKGVEFHLSRQWDSAEYYYLQAIPLAQEEKDMELLARLYNNMGLVAKERNNVEQIISNLESALSIYKSIGLDELYGATAFSLGVTYKELQEHDLAVKYLTECIEILEAYPVNKNLGSAYSTLGNLFSSLDEFDKALYYHNTTIAWRKKNDPDRLGRSYNNIGKLYLKMGEDSLSSAYLNKAMEAKYRLNDYETIGNTFMNLSKISIKDSKYQLALSQLDSALAYFKENNDSIELLYTANLKAKVYLIIDDHPNFRYWIDFAKKKMPSNPGYDPIIENLSLEKEYYLIQRDYKSAIEVADSISILSDLKLFTERNERLAQLQAIHRVNLLKSTILKQENKLLQTANNRNIAIGVAILIIVGAIFIYREKRRSDQRRKESEAARLRIETLLREMHHRIKNNLSAFSGIMGLEMRRVSDEDSRELLRDNQNRLKAISKIHQKLYLSTEEALAKVDLNSYLIELCEEVMFNFNYRPEDIDLQFDMDQVDLDTDRAILLGQLLNEALTNAFKYAFKDHPHPALCLSLRQKDDQLRISLKDNGPGILESTKKNIGSGIGSTLFKELSKQLKADYTMQKEDGVEHIWILNVTTKKAA